MHHRIDPIHREAPTLVHQLTARLAYWLWQMEGRPEGRDREFWFEAERLLVVAFETRLGIHLERADA